MHKIQYKTNIQLTWVVGNMIYYSYKIGSRVANIQNINCI